MEIFSDGHKKKQQEYSYTRWSLGCNEVCDYWLACIFIFDTFFRTAVRFVDIYVTYLSLRDIHEQCLLPVRVFFSHFHFFKLQLRSTVVNRSPGGRSAVGTKT